MKFKFKNNCTHSHFISVVFGFFQLICFNVNAESLQDFFEPAIVENKINTSMRVHQYEVTLKKNLREANVKICFDGKPPQYLAVDYKKATKNIIDFPVSNKGHLEYHGRFWKTENLAENACINYKVDISGYLSRSKLAHRDGPTISFQNDNLWLWLPEKISNNESVEIVFNLPANYQISSPWALINENENRYKIESSAKNAGFTLMIGEFELRKIVMAGRLKLNVAILTPLKQKDNLTQWVINSLKSVINYVGTLNLSHLQVILIED